MRASRLRGKKNYLGKREWKAQHIDCSLYK